MVLGPHGMTELSRCVLVFALFGSVSVAGAQVNKTETHEAYRGLRVGEPLPWFAGWRPDNTILNRTKLVSNLKGRGAVISIFATWCVECRVGLSALAQHRDAFKEKKIEVVLVAYEEPIHQVAPYLKTLGLDWAEVILDKFGKTSIALGAVTKTEEGKLSATLPVTVAVDSSGVIRGIFTREGLDYVEKVITSLGQGA